MDGLLRMVRRELKQMIKIAKIWSGVGQIVEVVESVSRMGEDSVHLPTPQINRWINDWRADRWPSALYYCRCG